MFDLHRSGRAGRLSGKDEGSRRESETENVGVHVHPPHRREKYYWFDMHMTNKMLSCLEAQRDTLGLQ